MANIFLRGLFGDTVPGRALPEPLPVHGDQVLVVGTCEGPAHLVGLGGGHPPYVHEQLDDLLLPDDDAVPPLQRALLQRVVVVPGDAVPVALHEPAHRAALDADAGPDEGDLVGEVEEVAGAEALPHLELGWRLEEEDALGPAFVDHVVHVGVFGVELAQVGPPSLPLLNEVEGLLDLVEHGEGESIVPNTDWYILLSYPMSIDVSWQW